MARWYRAKGRTAVAHSQRTPTPETQLLGPKKETKYRSTPYSPQRSVRTPKLCPGTALGVLGKLREPCAVRARPNPAAVAPS